MENNMENKNEVKFYGGAFVPWIPIIVMIAGMVFCVATGNAGLLQFAMMGFFGLIVGFLIAKDKKNFGNICFAGLQNTMLSTVIMAFLLAGVMSQLLKMSGLIDGLIWAVGELNLHTGFIPVICFLACVLISTSCGTSAGSVTAVAPVLIPLALELDCNLGLVCGAIVSGAIFGDNLAPISDTTIGSALTQEAKVADVVRTRLPYSLIAGGISAVLFIILGLRTTSEQAASINIDSSNAKALALLVIPILMVVMMKFGLDLVSTLLICDIVGIVLNLVLGCMTPATLFSVDGPITQGLSGMLQIILFLFMLFVVLEILNQSGAFDQLLDRFTKVCKTPRSAEFVCMLCTGIGAAAAGGSSPAIMFFGPMVRKILKKFDIVKTRGANIMDATACGVSGLLPYGTCCMLSVSFALQCEGVDPKFSFMDIIPYNFHCYFLLLLFLLSILTGVGRHFESEGKEA